MSRPVLLLTGESYYKGSYIQEKWPKLVERCEIRLSGATGGAELAAALAEADVALPRWCTVDRAVLEAAPRLRGLVTPGVGVEKVDVASATELGILVANSPGNSLTVAESTILLALALSKQMMNWIAAGKRGKGPDSSMYGMELRGKTIGFVGFGRIGRIAAELARAFGMERLAYDPYVEASDLAELTSLDDLLRRSDFVSLHPVLTAETRKMIGAPQFALMKPTAYLINTSRGGVVDEAALIQALQAGHIAGAGLDVFEIEPPELDNPLLSMPNVIATPHGLSHARESFERCASMAQQSILDIIDGRRPEFTVNKKVVWRAEAKAAV
jgi:D-3-phosphoglycerate dehydrogenase